MTEPILPDLTGQSAIVTGASSGIGQACAIALAECGANVAVNYYGSPDGAQETVDACLEHGVKAISLAGDVSKEEDVAALFADAIDHFGAIDIAVANAGIQKDAAFTDLTKADWDRVIGVNLTGQFLVMQAAVRQFRAQGMRQSRALGKIIAMSSVHDVIPWAGHVNYATAKGGVSMLMKTAAQELASERIRVNAVSPGAIATAINKDVWSDPQKAEALNALIPYARIGQPREIAAAVVWLASDASDYVNGHTLVVDGGMELYPEFRDNG
ncbi:glucose 1-dehydrogenase [Acuticoccus sp. M5D2P5]|uniref:glucose 1-dehydrogenase n=1 Tax=Acuticoccus kalidii TaxID=2910977 RepID=UPI001F227372|nr:glucose 1-dehydrogenase [Acuticoccus kalidii]MCF3936575.1 glucose 1-dehydrogenase [Acuticoccus kalidii]